MLRAVTGFFGLAILASLANAGEIGFVEDFALAKDRAAALRQLIPGTEDYYYYHSLHYLNTGEFEKLEPFIRPWMERFGQTQRLTEIRTRFSILLYDRDPKRTLEFLRHRLNLRFDHQKADATATPNLPTALDQQLIARNALQTQSFNRWQNLENFENSALDWLASENLTMERRRNLLQRLERPDLANLPRLVADDLAAQHPPEFGAYAIHRQMTQAQLDELLKLRPALLNHTAFVQTYLAKLQPGADEDWRHDAAKTQAFLDRLLSFVRRLSPAHNGLKAHVLYHRLVLDRSQGTFDRALFLEYLKLPRQQQYMAKALVEAPESMRYPADLKADYAGATMMRPIHGDEPLVRDYLKHFFATADSPREFAPYINDVYLTHLFVETKIELGQGDAEQWAAQLPPEQFRQLKERIDIDFSPSNKTNFAADETVKVDLSVKNVSTMIVKVFEINAPNFYRAHQRDIDTDINLDGLVANAELTQSYPEPPLRRVPRRFEFPQLTKPGVYVIDFIGAGKSSRVLVRKGRLRPLVATTTAGQSITVVDEKNQLVKDAAIWLGGHEYSAGPDGTILVPFSTAPGRHTIVIRRGDFASLDHIDHQAEGYHLDAGIHVDRESLLTQRLALLLVRPGLKLNGLPVSVKLLDEVKLRIVATDHDGIATSTEVPNFKLFEDRESVHDFRVPPRLSTLAITLTGKVKSLSLNKQIDLAASATFSLNSIDKTDKIEDLHFAKFGSDYVLELLGRSGEPRPDRPVQLAIKHRDFKEPVQVTLKSDAKGRVMLGGLAEIASVTATGPEGVAHTWSLPLNRHTYRKLIHSKAGESVTTPYLGAAAGPTREEFALFEMVGSLIRGDRFEALAIHDGLLELRGLAAGDYDLWLKRKNERIRIRVVDGAVLAGHVLGQLRHLELPPLKPVQIGAIATEGDNLVVRLLDASKFARVHIFATRYQPEFSAFDDLARVRAAELKGTYPAHADTVYLAGRNIGDEYRYVLDRKYQKKFAGNMLERPALLLNPWAIRSTDTTEQLARAGDEFAARGQPPAAKPAEAPAATPAPMHPEAGAASAPITPNLDFLASASAVLVNLVPDDNGVITIGRDKIGPHAMIHVVAVDPLSTTYRSLTMSEQPTSVLDLRLRAGLDPKGHFTQQKQVSILAAKESLSLADAAAGRFEVYDSLGKVFGLYTTLRPDPKLTEFAFILNWPKLRLEEKRDLYSKHACHELNFFIAKKDPEFFRLAIQPYLANKKDKTFLDRWLIGDELQDYLEPWKFDRLNTVERVLLAQRIAGEPAKTARHLNDLIRLQPPQGERMRQLFETAVKLGDLGVADRFGINKAKMIGGITPQGNVLQSIQNDPADKPQIMPPPKDAGGVAGAPGGGAGSGGRAAKSAATREGRSMDRMEELGKKVEGERLAEDKKEYFFDESRGRRLAIQLYRRLDPTQEWAENNYHHLRIQQQLADLVPPTGFWLDYAKHDGKSPFLSKNLADPSRNFTEMMLALAVLDLPFAAEKHDVKFEGNKMTFTAAEPVVAFHEEVRPAPAADGKVQILVSQNFYRHGDRYREENGERIDKFVTKEFVVHTVYGCQVVVTNPTPARQRLAMLLQVPVGAVPVANGQFTKSVSLDLEPYRTQTVDYLFYFPKPGKFAHFPVHVAKGEALVANSAPFEFDVLAKPSQLDTQSWEYVSQNGTNEQVLAYLNRENIHALDLEKIAFRMRDRAFFTSVLALLQDRHVYQNTLWSYGVFHNVLPTAREFLKHADQIIADCGGPIDSPLITLDPIERHLYEHLEYKPLVNARIHSLGQRRQIVNAAVLEQYHRFMKHLGYRKQLTDNDQLAVTYYLLIQDRVVEALAAFGKIDPVKVAGRLQYDYCAAYLDMSGDEPTKARVTAARYSNYPVDRWRKAFGAIAQQLDEIEGKGPKVVDADERGQRQGELAAKTPVFDFTIDNKNINLTWQNLESVRVNYYLMDVELLFSRNPFVQQSGQFASIRPNATKEISLPAGQDKLAVPLPAELIRRNVLVEFTAAGKTRTLPYYANAMNVQVTENYGQLKVTEAASGKALVKVYVKTYVRLANGQVKFYKDGYTDHRGRFDYTSVSTPESVAPQRFAILVLSDEHGALIREAAPPQR